LAILLVWPLRRMKTTMDLPVTPRFFYFSAIPADRHVVRRDLKKGGGIWDHRAAILCLAAGGVAVVHSHLFLVSKRKGIRLTTAVLVCAAFLVSFGPWGSAGVSLTASAIG